MQRVGFGGAVMAPPPEQIVQTFVTIQILGLAVVSLIGLLLLWRLWSVDRGAPANSPYGSGLIGVT
jgi:hypothetical protein